MIVLCSPLGNRYVLGFPDILRQKAVLNAFCAESRRLRLGYNAHAADLAVCGDTDRNRNRTAVAVGRCKDNISCVVRAFVNGGYALVRAVDGDAVAFKAVRLWQNDFHRLFLLCRLIFFDYRRGFCIDRRQNSCRNCGYRKKHRGSFYNFRNILFTQHFVRPPQSFSELLHRRSAALSDSSELSRTMLPRDIRRKCVSQR